MLGRGWSNVRAYNRYVPNAISYHIYDNYSHRHWKVYFVYTSQFIVSPRYYSTSSGSMSFSFSGNLNDYYYEFHGIGNSFHDHNHDRDHVHRFGTISLSLQGMIQIQLNGTCDFSSNAHYFAQPQEHMVLI